jgi:phosphatidate cytidylyltransferase
MGGVLAVTTPGAPGLFATLVKRTLTAAIGIPLFVWMVAGGPYWMFALLVVVLSGVAAWELMRMFERSGWAVYGRLGVVGAAAVTASFLSPRFTAIVFTLAVAATLSAPVWADAAPAVEPAAATLLAIAYVGWLLGHSLLLRELPDGAYLVLFLVGTTWAGESAAYVIGAAVGRHPLSPSISPRKTVEGAAGQLAASVVAAAVLGVWFLPQWSVATTMLAGGLLGVVGQIGDLGESVIKRSLGAKDTGGLIPGHGGVLDRLDGLLFNTPALFYYASWWGGRG